MRSIIRNSIAVRLSGLFALASALILAAIGFYLYGALEKQMAARNEDHLAEMMEMIRFAMGQIPSFDSLVANPSLIGQHLVGHGSLRLRIHGNDGRTLFSSSALAIPKETWIDITPPYAPPQSRLWQETGGRPYRFVVASFRSDRPGLEEATIVLAMDVSEEIQALAWFKESLFGAITAGLLVAAGIGFLITRRGLRPIVQIAGTARRITASRLKEHLDLRDAPNELKELMESFNIMLGHLEDSFQRLSGFSADLAHEFRTPLTNMLGKTQVALLRARDAKQYREVLESNVEDIEQLSALISDMLFLAQTDHPEATLIREKIDLRIEAEFLIEFFGIAAEERGVALAANGEASVVADRLMIRRALSNLLSNAIRHSPDGERVEVVIEDWEADGVAVSVINRGPGIPPEHLSRVFDRLYRVDPSRARGSGGSGLGLAIVRSIMTLHGGEVSVESEPDKRTVFTLRFPTAVASKPSQRSM